MIVAVDIGTSVTKACLVDRAGRASCQCEVRSELRVLEGNRIEQDLDEVVGSVISVVRKAVAQAGEPIEALALTGQGDGLWLRDEQGAAVGPMISWMDGRAAPTLDAWSAGEPSVARQVFGRTGSGMFPGCAGPLLAHLAEHEPDRLARAAVAGYCVDAVVQRLTGEITVDASDASLPFLDVPGRRYSEAAIEACGLSGFRHLLVEPAPLDALFALLPEAAKLLDLPAGLPVSAGPFDLPACAFGSGATQAGDGSLVIGTTLGCQVLTDDVTIDPDAEPSGMWLATPFEGQYVRVMPAMVGTASLDWLLRTLGLDVAALPALLAESPPGANGVRVLPFLSPSGERAPFVDAHARGQFSGITVGTSRADLVRALCEAVAFSARHCLDTLGASGEISACGGGVRSPQWRQIFADILDAPLHLPEDTGIGARGAALRARYALGETIDRDQWRTGRDVVTPDKSTVDYYRSAYQRYRQSLSAARTEWSAHV
ncbi:MAG TPA: FGGY-family carbohydrate kinase [Pseudonocardiaceae bacterium]|jgi:xylulokinase/erythritol kinase|nr:FGGY-family carbohydrate kinase [Pseudonocardiaceae bacterium]